MKTLRLLTVLAGLFLAFRAFAVGTFIPATNRVDMVCDDARNLLYISSGSDVLRYDLSSDTFLGSFHVGGSLMGMDLSPDGNTLAVADAFSGGGSNWVHLIDLPTGVIREAYFALGFYETGTFSVAYGNDSALMISSQFAGSGWVPLRRYDPASGVVTTVASVRHSSMLCSSGDGSVVGVAEGDDSGGPTDRYSVSSHSIAGFVYAPAFGTTGLNTLVRGAGNARSYQVQFSAAALSGLPVGAQLTELRFRQDSSATTAFPPVAVNWTEYDVTMAGASNSVSGMSPTFANNLAAPVLVKSGALSVAANRFPAGGSPNGFASLLVFDTPYVYQGGDLVMLFRHPGSDSTNTTFLDALSTSTTGYGTDFKALSISSFTGSIGGSAAVTIPQIVFNYSPRQTISRAGTNAIVVGACGPPGGGYHVLASTNLFLPMSQWNPVTGSVFDSNGTFRYTNSITPDSPARFFRITLP